MWTARYTSVATPRAFSFDLWTILKRASPRTRLMAARLSRKMSPGIFGFHLKFERRVGLETVPETPRSRKPVAFDLPAPENVGERVETPGKLRTREGAPTTEGR